MAQSADELIAFGSPLYGLLLAVLVLARGMDFLSTYVATPNLVLEANPLARRLGWKWGLIINGILCAAFALAPLLVVIATTSLLVAARNLQSAWLMRTLGEESYRAWYCARIRQAPLGLYLFCLLLQTALLAGVGVILVLFSELRLVPLGIGMGILAYAVAVTLYTLLSAWRIRRTPE